MAARAPDVLDRRQRPAGHEFRGVPEGDRVLPRASHPAAIPVLVAECPARAGRVHPENRGAKPGCARRAPAAGNTDREPLAVDGRCVWDVARAGRAGGAWRWEFVTATRWLWMLKALLTWRGPGGWGPPGSPTSFPPKYASTIDSKW